MKTIGVVGATGLTGEAFTKILLDKTCNSVAVRLFAGESAGARIQHGSKWITVENVDAALQGNLDYAVFMTPPEISAKYAPLLAARGVTCIDNSPHFRNDKDVPLVVRQINGELISGKLIANPNCVTIQVAIALNALLPWQPKRLTVATYQSASGAGREGLADLVERRTVPHLKAFDNQIYDNVLPQIGEILPDGYTVEERKMQDELQKIFDKRLSVNCFAARVPVSVGHCAFVNVELEKPFSLQEVIRNVKNQPNVLVLSGNNATPRILCHTRYVAIGRIVEYTPTNSVNMFVVADNLLRGAAYNALEILESLLEKDGVTESVKTSPTTTTATIRGGTSTENARTANCDTHAAAQNTKITNNRLAFSDYTTKAVAANTHKAHLIGRSNVATNTTTTTAAVNENIGTNSGMANGTHSAITPSNVQADNAPHNEKSNQGKLLITALVTPFCNGRVHYPSIERLIATQGDVDAVVACGTTGEGHLLRADEVTQILRFIKATAPNLPTWATVTQTSTTQAVRQAETAAKIGASALLVCPPLFVNCSPQGFLQHVMAIRNATHLPICLYNVPHRCGYTLNKDIVQRLTENEVKYVKDCTADIQMQRIARNGLLCGSDELLPEYLKANAMGIVSVVSNAAPQLSRLALEGDSDCQTLFREVARLLARESNPICIKYLLYRLQIFSSHEVRLPLTPPSAPTKDLLDSFIGKYREILR